MKHTALRKLTALCLALLMILPMLVIPTTAASASGFMDFGGFTAGATLTRSDGFSAALAVNRVIEENGNKFLRIPMACSNKSSMRE